MTNRTKILLGIAIIILISLGVYIGIKNNKNQNSANNIQQNITNNIYDEYLNDEVNQTNEIDNDILSNEIETNEIDTNEKTTQQNIEKKNTTQSSTNGVIGKEEQESKNENTSSNDEETAIKLAKKEWAIDVDSFDFQANKNDDGTYSVTVINKKTRNTEAVYKVNIKTGTVTE